MVYPLVSDSYLSIINPPAGVGGILWNCVFSQGGYAWMWTPGYIPLEQTWWFNIGTSQVSVSVDMQIYDDYGFIYQRFGVPATIKAGASYYYNCTTHQVEEITAAFSQFIIADYSGV